MPTRSRPFRSRAGRRLLRLVGWLVGAPLASFRFARRQLPIEQVGAGEAPPSLAREDPDPAHREDREAVGAIVHQLHSATIEAPVLDAERLLAVIAADPNVIAPSEVLRFERRRAEPGGLREGERLLIRMAGPSNAPVEVTRRWEGGFRLAATRGNPQLGQLELRVRDTEGAIAIEIQTRERAAGLGFQLLRRIGLIRRFQTHTWAEMLENAAQLAGGRRPERLTVRSWGG